MLALGANLEEAPGTFMRMRALKTSSAAVRVVSQQAAGEPTSGHGAPRLQRPLPVLLQHVSEV